MLGGGGVQIKMSSVGGGGMDIFWNHTLMDLLFLMNEICHSFSCDVVYFFLPYEKVPCLMEMFCTRLYF